MNASRLRRLLGGLAVLSAAFLLGGCGTLVSNVTTYHSLAGKPPLSGAVYAKAEGSGTAAERQAYADRVVAGLARNGFGAAGSAKGAAYVATLTYSIDGGHRQKVRMPIYGQVWDGPIYQPVWIETRQGPRLVTYYNPPAYDVVGYQDATLVEYVRTARIVLVRAGSGQTVWEARNRSVGPEGEIGAVLPGMIDAMTRDFPGDPGRTRVVRGSAQ
ncbi:MAG TPA: hypothetical protein VIM58_11095 [Candidatus Methylacidiphilales bacterium]